MKLVILGAWISALGFVMLGSMLAKYGMYDGAMNPDLPNMARVCFLGGCALAVVGLNVAIFNCK